MNERQQIIYMQARLIRLASEKWGEPIERIAELFDKHPVPRILLCLLFSYSLLLSSVSLGQ